MKAILESDFNTESVSVELPRIGFRSMQELLDYCAELRKSASSPEEEMELEEFCQELVEAWFPKFASSWGGDEK